MRLNLVLDQAKPKDGAKTLLCTASDGFTTEVALADVRKTADALVGIGDQGNLQLVMPGMESKAWVKQLVSIEVK